MVCRAARVAAVKLIVMARGLGTRMQQRGATAGLSAAQATAAQRGAKALMPVEGAHGRVLLDYLLSRAADAGVTHVCLIVPPEHEAFLSLYRPSQLTRLSIDVAVQPTASGTAHAVLAARTWAAGDDCLVVNGDNLYPVDALRALVQHQVPALGAFPVRSMTSGPTALPRERLAGFALVQANAFRRLQRLVEKPDADTLAGADDDALISMNLWRIGASIMDACAAVPMSARGEYELPAAVMLAMAEGTPVDVCTVDGPVLDLSRQDDVPGVMRALRDEVVRL